MALRLFIASGKLAMCQAASLLDIANSVDCNEASMKTTVRYSTVSFFQKGQTYVAENSPT
ncbi:hypothetical protein THTE_3940 [Thermogutta terrifontis]|uniref:Uncharacterized protein n=1 Tax=Thermogutta terrifontis TaxID=1331910 RepID=A0A286RKQ0_9BACT|nr:hypothetical protein THTE_3940 [Thermogutta terrifontis]